MKTIIRIAVLLFCIMILGISVSAQSDLIKEMGELLDSAIAIESPVFAPQTYLKAVEKFEELRKAVELKKKQQSIDNLTSDFKGYVENAFKAVGVAQLALSEYLPPRNKAMTAKANLLVPELWQKAEEQFVGATGKVESGDVKGGLKEAAKSGPLYDTAEMEAIRVDVLGKADKLIAAAMADEAPKYALTTLDKARTARQKGNDILDKDRYNRKESVDFASRAEYEARHASNIAQSVRSLERNDQAWEKLMLGYEIEMQKAAAEAEIDLLHFDNGPMAASDSLRAAIKRYKIKINELEESSAGKDKELGGMKADLVSQMKATLVKIGATPTDDDPLKLAQELDSSAEKILEEKNRLANEMAAKEGQLTELEKSHQQVAAELDVRQQKEDKIKAARALINPSEGEIIFNSTGDIVLRLPGLSFDIGSAEIKDKQVPLLKKVEDVIKMFPESKLLVEGHTDNTGDPTGNTRLSDKRAFAVMQYLRQSLSIPAEKIQSAGYGSDRPVASNDSAEGRAKNRRIDIIIMQ